MNTSFNIASTGMKAYQGKLDSIANNIANVESTGYKRREATFADNLAVSIQNQTNQQEEIGRLTPGGIRTTFGSRIAATTMDITQGAPKQTNSAFDIMIEGSGFFQVRRNNGNTSEVLYTRNGSFQPMRLGNGTFQLVNAQGDILLDQAGNPVILAHSSEFQVHEDGTVDGSNQRIGVFTIQSAQNLTDEGGVYRLNGGSVSLANTYSIKQGYLESSNVELTKEMTDMIKAQRGYQANARAVSYADQMMGIANGIVRY